LVRHGHVLVNGQSEHPVVPGERWRRDRH
jgi:hypothetical protein